MTRGLALARRPPVDPARDALRAFAVALAPYLREIAALERRGEELVDVVLAVPASKRALMRACRVGEIAGAVRVARRWLAPKVSLDDWLRELGPRSVPAPRHGTEDDLESLRASLARNTARRG